MALRSPQRYIHAGQLDVVRWSVACDYGWRTVKDIPKKDGRPNEDCDTCVEQNSEEVLSGHPTSLP